MKFKSLQVLLALTTFSFFSCEKESVDADKCDPLPGACFHIFKTITLEIEVPDGSPVILDDFYTFYDSRKKFEYELNDSQKGKGIYPVITDSEMQELDVEGTTLIFVGVKNGRNLVEHQMVIGHDCCHVQLIEGEDKIVIEE